MSNRDEIDAWNEGLVEEMYGDVRDEYLQRIIDRLDDPDYEYIPIVIDPELVGYPSDHVSPLLVIKALQRAIDAMKEHLFRDD